MSHSDSKLPEPDPWAVEAASWPLVYAQTREDPRVEAEVLRLMPPKANVIMVASGGDTAVYLEALGVGRLTVVDSNPAQLALTRLKRHLARHHAPAFAPWVLGHLEMKAGARQVVLSSLLATLELENHVFGPLEGVAALGPAQVGRHEILCAQLWRELSADQETLGLLVCSVTPSQATALLSAEGSFGALLDRALAKVMSQQNLACLFGDAVAQPSRQPWDRHFAERIRLGATQHPASDNPFLWQMLVGMFPPRQSHDWITMKTRPRAADWLPDENILFQHASMQQALDELEEGSVELVLLSDILDALPAGEVADCLQRAHRVLRPGGRVVVRQLNSTLDLPAIECGLEWDRELGMRLLARDRSFCNNAIHVGAKV